MPQTLDQLLDQGQARTKRQGWIVSMIVLALAGLMTSLYWLDPEVKNYSTGMMILYFLVDSFFYGVGFFMIYSMFVIMPKRLNTLKFRLKHETNMIAKAYHYVVVSKAANATAKSSQNAVGAQNYLRVEYADGTMIQLSFLQETIAQILAEIYKVAPHARQK